MIQKWYRIGTALKKTAYLAKETMLDDAEPQWKSIGYRRDLGKQPPAPLKPKPPLPDALVAHSLLSPGDQRDAKDHDDWNTDESESALKCNDKACPKLNHDTNEHCRKFGQLGENRSCQYGEKTADVYQTYVLDLIDTDDSLREAAQQLEAKSLNDRTTYVRMVVWNFASTRMRALRHFLAKLPLVRELLLPDRDYCPFHLLTVMELIHRHLYNKCPRLQWMVFRDGTADTL